jgi:hypothetical protein
MLGVRLGRGIEVVEFRPDRLSSLVVDDLRRSAARAPSAQGGHRGNMLTFHTILDASALAVQFVLQDRDVLRYCLDLLGHAEDRRQEPIVRCNGLETQPRLGGHWFLLKKGKGRQGRSLPPEMRRMALCVF